jgi:hypothetical protein
MTKFKKSKMKSVIKVNNMGNFEFWLGMYKPRSEEWKREHLKYLEDDRVHHLDSRSEREDKIKALRFSLT